MFLRGMKKVAIEILLVLIISLLLTVVYTVVSHEGMIIMKRIFKKNASVERAVHISEVDVSAIKMQEYF